MGAAILFGCLYLSAALFARAASAPDAFGNALHAFGLALLDPQWIDIGQTVAVLLCAAIAFAIPQFLEGRFRRVESVFSTVASRRKRAVLLAGLLPIVIRLALLPALPAPQPGIADEFGHLLIADTFASGRVTNPTHPMWAHFEETYILHQPSYTSVYPIAPAVFLAVPKLFHATPWLGVLAAAGLMCALICWALQAWAPPGWALLGAMIAIANVAVASPWINTYWGGAVPAAGGALLLGAIGRMLTREHPVRNSLLCGLALAIIAQSRPYEGFFFTIPLFGGLVYWIHRKHREDASLRWIAMTAPMIAVLAAALAGMAYYNWRVTGDPLLLPPALQQRQYGMPQSFFWQRPILNAPRVHRFKEIADVFVWQLDAYKAGITWPVVGARLLVLWRFFLEPVLTVPLLFVLPLLLKRTWLRILFLGIVLMLAANFLYPFFFPHYIAPAYAALLLLVIEGLRRLRAFRFHFRPVGLPASRLLGGAVFGASATLALGSVLLPGAIVRGASARSFVEDELGKRGGSHLVLVRYKPGHTLHLPIVYNDADIDRSPIVWAHRIDDATDRELIDYFKNREVWYFNPDVLPLHLVPAIRPYVTAVVNGAGDRDDRQQGVSPGGIAVVLGGNFGSGNLAKSAGVLNPFFDAAPVRLVEATAKLGGLFEESPIPTGRDRAARFLPRRWNDLTVEFNNVPAPIFSVFESHGEQALTVEVPFETPLGTATVTVRGKKGSGVAKVLVLAATPGIFEIRRADSNRQALVLREDGSLVDWKHPARRGESLRLLCTGLGPGSSAIATGQTGPAPAVPLVYPLVVGVNNSGVPVSYARFAPDLIGIEEAGFQVPADAPSGPSVTFAIGVRVNGKTVFGNSSWIPIE